MSRRLEKKTKATVRITTFEVWKGGTLAEAGFEENAPRRDFYYCRNQWKDPDELVTAMDECPPLAWQVLDAYSDALKDLEAKLESASPATARKLKARLEADPGYEDAFDYREVTFALWNTGQTRDGAIRSSPSGSGWRRPRDQT